MNRSEFNAFLSHVQALFPSVRSWFEGMVEADRRDMLAAWAEVFADVPAGAGRSVVQQILAGEIPRPFHEELAGVIRSHARALTALAAAEEASRSRCPSFCALCQNTGFVSVWHPLTIRALDEGCDSFQHPGSGETFTARKAGRIIAATVIVACGCSAGEVAAKRRVHSPTGWREVELPRFSAGKYVPVRSCRPEADWVAARQVF